MTNDARKAVNAKRMSELHPTLARKVAAILRDLEGHGLAPMVATGWRSPKDQAAAKKAGNSTVAWGFHCAMKGGKPYSLAADVVDASKGWEASAKFWNALGSSAHAHGLVWGGDWRNFPDVAHVQLVGNEKLSAAAKGWLPEVT